VIHQGFAWNSIPPRLRLVFRTIKMIVADFVPFAVLFGFILLVISLHIARARAQQAVTIVWSDVSYPNNHFVDGAGYYHAAYHRWFPHPWNEFREGQGYYWNGDWHLDPDQTFANDSRPGTEEIQRVNALWCASNPSRHRAYLKAVKRFGFGISEGRREGA
jgi:hypothetical protein